MTNSEECDIDGNDLLIELQVLIKCCCMKHTKVKSEKHYKSIQTMEYTRRMNIFLNVLVVCRILLKVLVTAASPERSFSKLKLLKSYKKYYDSRKIEWIPILSIESEFLQNID